MKELKKSLWELLSSHIKIWQSFQNELTRYNQLDFLTFRVKETAWKLENPFKIDEMRDNPNWELTNRPNTYKLIDIDKKIIQFQFIESWHAPIMLFQWYYEKTPSCEGWKICVYWKGLRLYYLWKIDWLRDYIYHYAWKVIRADLCRDSPNDIDPWVVDLSNTITIWKDNDWSYKWFGKKNSPLFIRIYDKTLDLKKDKFSMAWLYPAFYQKKCRRLECKLTWRYASSYSALEWLDLINMDLDFIKETKVERNYIKSALYNLIQSVDYIPDTDLQAQILQWCKDLSTKKLTKILRFKSVNNLWNDEHTLKN